MTPKRNGGKRRHPGRGAGRRGSAARPETVRDLGDRRDMHTDGTDGCAHPTEPASLSEGISQERQVREPQHT